MNELTGSERRIGILTSGGDAPGMNAAIRAVARTAVNHGIRVFGFLRGYEGLIANDFIKMGSSTVSDIIHRGGTILKTARCPEMMTLEGQNKAAEVCLENELDALVVIGGDGSFKGAYELSKLGVNVFCIPATIDRDVHCSEYTIGFDTAVTTGMEAINKIKDTSSSHERCSVFEVMGRNSGHIAFWVALCGGAEEVVVPELEKEIGKFDKDRIILQILKNRASGKTHNLIVIAEGVGGTEDLARTIESETGIETRATILGYIQRGGMPTAVDRMHASMMGYNAVKAFSYGMKNQVIAIQKGEYRCIEIEKALKIKLAFNPELYDIIKVLSI